MQESRIIRALEKMVETRPNEAIDTPPKLWHLPEPIQKPAIERARSGKFEVRLFGFTLVRVDSASMGLTLPHGSFALFRFKRRVEKDDIVLVDHPQCGIIVKRIAAVSRSGRYALRGMSAMPNSEQLAVHVEGICIRGTLMWRTA